ncbi:unnamed protein product [Lymnaea stagnalis]|uniref:Phosphoglycerate kinase n=1 Tax=Lymnaea stagnalis TaxID=6523 RepID=A0AAV2HH17_LYMST
MNSGNSAYNPISSFTTSCSYAPSYSSSMLGTSAPNAHSVHVPNSSRSYIDELRAFDIRDYLPCPKDKLDIKLNFSYTDDLKPYLAKEPAYSIKYDSQFSPKTFQPAGNFSTGESYFKEANREPPKMYIPKTFIPGLVRDKVEEPKKPTKKAEAKPSTKTKPSAVDPDHNNNFFKDYRGKFGGVPERWANTNVYNRIEELAKPKRLPCEYRDNRRSVYWITRRPPPKDECCNHTHFETSDRLDELAVPKVVCGEFCGNRYVQASHGLTLRSCIDPRTVDWCRLAVPKRKYPPNGLPIQPVKRSALKALATKRLCKLSEPKRVINSDKYYLWLWKKKPDNMIMLKKVRRRSIDKCDLTNIRVMLRCQLTCSPKEDACEKLKAIIPTIKFALEHGAQSVVVIAACGEPKDHFDEECSFQLLTEQFEALLEHPVIYLEDCVGYQARSLCEDPEPGSVFLLENLCFHPEEVGKYIDKDGKEVICKPEAVQAFCSTLFGLGDIYVVDNISELVNMTNTTVGVKDQEKAYGFIVKSELDYYNRFIIKPKPPMLAIVGGKFYEKTKLLRNLMGKANEIILGGELAMIFLKAIKKIDIGNIRCTTKMLKKALKLHSRAKDTKTVLYLPSDVVVRNIKTGEYFTVLTREDIDEDYEVVDIGPFTRGCYENVVAGAQTIVWCGKMGDLSDGTSVIASAFAQATQRGAATYIADDVTKEVFFVDHTDADVTHPTANGDVTTMLLNGSLPKGLSVLNKYRKKIKKRMPLPVIPSGKPTSYEIPGMMIDNGGRLLCINDVPLEDKRILIRVDFDVPSNKANNIANDYRIRMTIPTIKYALRSRAKAVIIMAHYGAPRGKKVTEMTLKPICDALASLLGQTVLFLPETVGKSVDTALSQMHPGSVVMLENLRFNMGEEGFGEVKSGILRTVENVKATPENLAQFCENLSNIGDVYVNDAFACLHQDHSSLIGYYGNPRVCGFLVKNELKYMAKVFNNLKRKFLVIFGGRASRDKLLLLLDLMKEADNIIIAGELASLFLKLDLGMSIGKYSFDSRTEDIARAVIELAPYYKCKLHYPVDLWIANTEDSSNAKLHSITKPIPEGMSVVDVGDLSASMFTRIVRKSNIILWVGAIGLAHMEQFSKATRIVLDAIKDVTSDPEKEVISIVCGRSSSESVHKYSPTLEGITHLSTGGITVLKLLTERKLTALDYLSCKPLTKPPNVLTPDSGEFAEQRVLIKADLDLPIEDGQVKDTFPLRHLVPLIKYLQRKGARAITLMGYRGDPKGKVNEEFSLLPLKEALESVLDQPVVFIPDGVSDIADVTIRSQETGRVLLLENTRFHPEEEGIKDAPEKYNLKIKVSYDGMNEFRNKLTSLGDVFINESFESLYQTHSSVVGLKHKTRFAGPTLKKDITRYIELKNTMERPLLAIFGGDEVHQHMKSIMKLLDVVNDLIVCGNVAFSFLAYEDGTKLGQSPVDKAAMELIPKILKKARYNGVTIHLPTDFVVAESLKYIPPESEPEDQDEDAPPPPQLPRTEVVTVAQGIPKTQTAFDIGPATIQNFSQVIGQAKTIVYVGDAGAYEHEPFGVGTKAILATIQAATINGAVAVAVGMKTVVCINKLNALEAFMSYSTGVQTFVDILCNRSLPGLAVLSQAHEKKLKKLRIDQMDLKGKRVLLRLDLFVPTVEGVVLDTDKLEEAAPTIKFALKAGAKSVVLLGHRGEPNGFKNHYLKMAPLVVEFNQILELKVTLIDRPCSFKARAILADPTPGTVFLMENLKFYPAEYGRDAEVAAAPPGRREDITISETITEQPPPPPPAEKSEKSSEQQELTTVPENEDEEPDIDDNTVMSLSDGDGGRSIDAAMFQTMAPKTVAQFKLEIGTCGDVFINDDVTDVEEALTSFEGFGLEEKGIGLQMIRFMQDADDTVYLAPGLVHLSPAPAT